MEEATALPLLINYITPLPQHDSSPLHTSLHSGLPRTQFLEREEHAFEVECGGNAPSMVQLTCPLVNNEYCFCHLLKESQSQILKGRLLMRLLKVHFDDGTLYPLGLFS